MLHMAELERSYLVVGNDRAKVTKVVARLKSHFTPDAIESYIAAKGSAQGIVDTCNMMGLLASQRLIIVTGVQDWDKDDVSAMLAYLAAPSPDAVVLCIAEKFASNARLRKAFVPPRLIDCAGPTTPAAIAKWAGAEFVAAGANVDQRAVTLLVELCGTDSLDRLRSDIERIATYAGADPVTVDMIEQLATRQTDEAVWKLGDAWARRDRAVVLQMTEQLLSQREHPVRIVGALGRHLRLVNDAHHLLRGNSPAVALQALTDAGANNWAAKSAVQQAQSIGTAQVDAALARVALLDAELKGANALGSGRIGEDAGTASRIVLERGVCELV